MGFAPLQSYVHISPKYIISDLLEKRRQMPALWRIKANQPCGLSSRNEIVEGSVVLWEGLYLNERPAQSNDERVRRHKAGRHPPCPLSSLPSSAISDVQKVWRGSGDHQGQRPGGHPRAGRKMSQGWSEQWLGKSNTISHSNGKVHTLWDPFR